MVFENKLYQSVSLSKILLFFVQYSQKRGGFVRENSTNKNIAILGEVWYNV